MFSAPLSDLEISFARPLAREFYQRSTETVARELVGKILVREHSDGMVAVRVSEVEAYLGAEDPACHTFGGRRTARNGSMWGEAGNAYVYLVYGIHHCLNLVTVGPESGQAVLIRGGVPIVGKPLIRARRGSAIAEMSLCDGPGKLCQALAITRCDDGLDVCGRNSQIYVADDGLRVMESEMHRGPRVGVGYAGEAAHWPLRFLFRQFAPSRR